MKKKGASDIISFYFKKLNKQVRRIKKDFDEKTIHKFRMNVKRLRAWLRMWRLASAEPGALKFPRRFKTMYAITGDIRDRQLVIKKIKEKKTGQAPRKIAELEKEMRELQKRKTEFLSRKEMQAIEETIKNNFPEGHDITLARHFCVQKKETINKIIAQKNYKDKDLHQIRKCIKDIIYINRIFKEDLKVSLSVLFPDKPEAKKAEDLAHKLGLFNDTCTASMFITGQDVRKADPAEKEYLLSLQGDISEEKQELKKEILSEIAASIWIYES